MCKPAILDYTIQKCVDHGLQIRFIYKMILSASQIAGWAHEMASIMGSSCILTICKNDEDRSIRICESTMDVIIHQIPTISRYLISLSFLSLIRISNNRIIPTQQWKLCPLSPPFVQRKQMDKKNSWYSELLQWWTERKREWTNYNYNKTIKNKLTDEI